MNYTKEQAINILDTYIQSMALNRDQHTQIIKCLEVLRNGANLEMSNNGIKVKDYDKSTAKK